MGRPIQVLSASVFCLLLSLPALLYLGGARQRFPSYLGRPPAEASWDDFHPLVVSAYEALADSIRDALPLRARALDFVARTDVTYFSHSSDRKVMVGRDGWLFLSAPLTRAADHKTKEVRRILEAPRAAVEALGARHLLVVVPRKASIYPEKLPAPRRPSLREGLTAQLRSDPSFLDLSDALREARAESPALLYHPTGTHWTDAGAFIGFSTLVAHLRDIGLAIEPVDPAQYPPRVPGPDYLHRSAFRGFHDRILLNKLGVHAALDPPDLQRVRAPRTIRCKNGKLWRIRGPDLRARCPERALRALILRDSTARWLVPYLSEAFQQTDFLWRRVSVSGLEAQVRRTRPDLVIEIYDEHALTMMAWGHW